MTRHLTFRVRDGARCFSSCPACAETRPPTLVGSNSRVIKLPPAPSPRLDVADTGYFTNMLAFALRAGAEPKVIIRMIGHRVRWEQSR